MITKHDFVNVLNTMKEEDDKAQELSQAFRQAGIQDWISGTAFFASEIRDSVLAMIDGAFGEDCDWVRYFVYELDFGSAWREDTIADANNNSIDISTAEKLYDFLIEEFVNKDN